MLFLEHDVAGLSRRKKMTPENDIDIRCGQLTLDVIKDYRSGDMST